MKTGNRMKEKGVKDDVREVVVVLRRKWGKQRLRKAASPLLRMKNTDEG
jgi:hypothetical protein